MSDDGTNNAGRIHVASALFCVALALGCSSEPLTVPGQARPVPGCEAIDARPCNTLDHDCQVSRLELAACMRETQAGLLPRISVMTEQQYVDFINAANGGRLNSNPNHFEVAMTWLGLTQPGSFNWTPQETADVADWFGTYRWREKDVLMIDHGRRADDAASNVALVTAFIRVLRDRDIDIAGWTTAVSVFDVDSNWGADAMYLGESRFFGNRYQAALDGIEPARFDEFALINQGIQEDIAWIRSQPSPYVATNARFPHNFGARASYLAWRRNGVDAVNALFDGKLLTHQLMTSENEENPPPPLKLHDLPRASDDWQYDPIMQSIGAWGLYLSLCQHLDEEAAWSLALKWSGEQLFVYRGVEPNDDETALIWQLDMADEESASALEDALNTYPNSPEVRRSGTFVTLVIETNQAPTDWAFVAN
ncbi:MAG TPA: hypothetical protein VER11_29855 [Polyangiaceae bacterium]|nr:hypothetical protein [Polyangiaceae bacterium]